MPPRCLTTVLLYTDSAEPSGVGEHMLTLGEALHRVGEYCVLFACSPAQSGLDFLERAAARGLEALPIGSAGELQTLLASREIDVFHLHAGIGWEGHEGVYCARRAGVRAVIRTEHLPYLLTDPGQQRDYIEVVKQVDRVICVSEEARDTFVDAGVPAEKAHSVYNGIAIRTIDAGRDDIRVELGLPAGSRLCLTVGRMTEQKGHRYLLDAIPRILAEVPDAHFLWVGVGPLEQELKEKAQELGLYEGSGADCLHFLGRRHDVARLMAQSNLFALPSLFEGLPLAVLEAMSCGLPVVGTDVLGTREAVQDGVSGRLVAPGSEDELVVAVVQLLTQKEKAETLSRNALERVRTCFSAELMARNTANIYQDVLNKRI